MDSYIIQPVSASRSSIIPNAVSDSQHLSHNVELNDNLAVMRRRMDPGRDRLKLWYYDVPMPMIYYATNHIITNPAFSPSIVLQSFPFLSFIQSVKSWPLRAHDDWTMYKQDLWMMVALAFGLWTGGIVSHDLETDDGACIYRFNNQTVALGTVRHSSWDLKRYGILFDMEGISRQQGVARTMATMLSEQLRDIFVAAETHAVMEAIRTFRTFEDVQIDGEFMLLANK